MSKIGSKGKGMTLWFTGLPSSGKTTLGSALQIRLESLGFNTVVLDGDVLRKGLNKDLKFSPEDRHENNRRVSEVAKLFSENGFITIVAFISPYAIERQNAREIHRKNDIKFVEIFIKTPLSVCEKRDVKGLYKLARESKIQDLTGVQSPYEEPTNPDIVIDTSEEKISDCVNVVIWKLQNNFELYQKIDNPMNCIPIKELFVDTDSRTTIQKKAESYTPIELTKVDLEWVQILAEGWASPLKGFMSEIQYLQCLHFSMIKDSDMETWHILPLPIVLSITDEKKAEIETKRATAVKLTYKNNIVAVMENIQIYSHRKEERVARKFSLISRNHPTIKDIFEGGDWLIGGDLNVLDRIKWEDGLDQYRMTPKEIKEYIRKEGHDAVVGFQLRNPIHNGHALLMQNTFEMLMKNGYKSPLLLLHPLGGHVKDDDVPLDVRMKQHEAIFEENVLDKSKTLLAIFPSPMSYAGPTEVLWHCRARIVCGVNYYIVGRDPAGLPHPEKPNHDLYDPTHGAKILVNAPFIENSVEIVPFTVVAYHKNSKRMEIFEPSKKEEFEFISGTKMRNFARSGIDPPEGFMAEKAWNVLKEYYRNK